jgi:hypothetical protein
VQGRAAPWLAGGADQSCTRRSVDWLEARPGAQGLLAAAAWRAGAGPGGGAGSWRQRRSSTAGLDGGVDSWAALGRLAPGAAWHAGVLAAATWRAGAGPGGGAGGAQGQILAAAAWRLEKTLAAAARRPEENLG